MPDIGWMELLVIGIVALIVVGPKDLPMMFRKLGQFTGRVRAMAKDFQRAMDEAADETGMSDLNRDLKTATRYARNPKKAGMNALKDTFGDDFDLDPESYEEGTETRRMAEEKAEATRKMRAEVEARRKARDEQAIADKEAAASAAAEAPLEAPVSDAAPRGGAAPTPAADPEPRPEPEPEAAAPTGSSRS
jgi:sec-independent protein translocase protein TatB